MTDEEHARQSVARALPQMTRSRMRTLFTDLRYAFRVMFRTSWFAVAVVSVLALSIGAILCPDEA